jgi:hypothetical protein
MENNLVFSRFGKVAFPPSLLAADSLKKVMRSLLRLSNMLRIAGDFIAADLRTTNWKPSLEMRMTELVSAIVAAAVVRGV